MSGLFSKPAPPPAIPAPTIMPVAGDEELRKARRKSVAAQKKRGGRESTILTDKLGGG
jgi:hypothetical protein